MQKYIPALLLILIGVISRLFPHPANFAPIAAIGLFAGMYLPRKYAIAVPAIALLASDIVLGFYLWQVMVAVYLCFALSGFIGMAVHKKFSQNPGKNWLGKFNTLFAGTLLGSAIFFIATNWAVWAFGTMYPHTVNGLLQSYTLALPFFKNTLLGDLFYTAVLVGSMEAILYIQKNRQAKTVNV